MDFRKQGIFPEDEKDNFFDTSLEPNLEGQLAVDVFQTPKEIIIKAPIAGVEPEDIEVSVTDDAVTIKGERKEEKKVEKENYFCQECYWGAFSRTIVLPVPAATDKAKATFKNGVLTITIPKTGKSKSKLIKVKKVS